MENSMEVPEKTKNRTTLPPSNPTAGHIPWEHHNSKRVMYHNAHCSSIYNSQNMEATKVSIIGWMDKEDVAHIYNGILLSHKKKRNGVICGEVDGARVCHTEWSKSEREKHILYANTYIWNQKKMVMWFLSFLLLMWCITLTDFCMLNHPCDPGLKPTWSWCMILFMYCWILFANILLRIFESIVIKDTGLLFSFF